MQQNISGVEKINAEASHPPGMAGSCLIAGTSAQSSQGSSGQHRAAAQALAESKCIKAAEAWAGGCPGWAGSPGRGSRAGSSWCHCTGRSTILFLQITCCMGLPEVCWDFPVGWGLLLLLNCSPKADGAYEMQKI